MVWQFTEVWTKIIRKGFSDAVHKPKCNKDLLEESKKPRVFTEIVNVSGTETRDNNMIISTMVKFSATLKLFEHT